MKKITKKRNVVNLLLCFFSVNMIPFSGTGFVKDCVNAPAYDQATPLYVAAQEGHYKCVETLLQYGADANAKVPVGDCYLTALQVSLNFTERDKYDILQ